MIEGFCVCFRNQAQRACEIWITPEFTYLRYMLMRGKNSLKAAELFTMQLSMSNFYPPAPVKVCSWRDRITLFRIGNRGIEERSKWQLAKALVQVMPGS